MTRLSPDALERIGSAHRGKLVDDQYRKRMSDAHGGSPHGVGVSKHKLCNKFMARATLGGKEACLGLYDTVQEAQAARRAALVEYYDQRNKSQKELTKCTT
jgi:hypothetical protein